jgi:Mce-associated membrane protein
MANPTWYDILGITPDASPEQVKAAWRDATDKFEPGTGASQFRLFNEAADVLLSPEKRAEYDAELGLAPTVTEAPAPEATPAEKTAAQEVPAAPAPEAAAPAPTFDAPPVPYAVTGGIATGAWVVAVIAVLAVASLVVAGIFAIKLENKVHDRQNSSSAGAEASAVAERALNVVFSYDYRHMDADRDRSAKFLTPKYGKQYEKTFTLLTTGPNGTPGPAIKLKAVVKATVLSTAVQDAEPGEVRVLVFVNQTRTKDGGSASIFQNRVVATMVKKGGDWLIDDVDSY